MYLLDYDHSSYHSKESYPGERFITEGEWKNLGFSMKKMRQMSTVPLGKECVAISQDLDPKHAFRDFKNKLRFSKDKNAILTCNNIFLPKHATYAFI